MQDLRLNSISKTVIRNVMLDFVILSIKSPPPTNDKKKRKMECYATPWQQEGELDFIYFLRALLSRESPPLSLFVGIFSFFAPSVVGVHACRPEGLPEGMQ